MKIDVLETPNEDLKLSSTISCDEEPIEVEIREQPQTYSADMLAAFNEESATDEIITSFKTPFEPNHIIEVSKNFKKSSYRHSYSIHCGAKKIQLYKNYS